MMIGTSSTRLLGMIACLATVASGWDAEAACGRHHRRACCAPAVECCPTTTAVRCCEPIAAPSCCEPACVSSCATCWNGCSSSVSCCYRPVYRYTVVTTPTWISAPACCASDVVESGVVLAAGERLVPGSIRESGATPAASAPRLASLAR